MKINDFFSQIPARYRGYSALLLWGVIAALLLRQDAYGLDEGAARCLLLIWSIADQIANATVTFGTPDLRLALFLPVGYLWTGNVFAVKIFTLLLTASSAWLLYAWQQRRANAESALIATGLLLLSPLLVAQIDALAPGVYLLLIFGLGEWLNNAYRASLKSFGGYYFAQLGLCALGISLHPAGLAYPLALAWTWHKTPVDAKQQKYFFLGIGLVTIISLAIRMGWNDTEWLHNPLDSLAAITFPASGDGDLNTVRWIVGAFALVILLITVAKQYRELWADFTGRILLLGLILGAFSGDLTWALIALVTILYFGLPLLLRAQAQTASNFFSQRGIALMILIVLSTLFMHTNKARFPTPPLSGQDQLIQMVADAAENLRSTEENSVAPRHQLRVASQWPSRTMIACRCDTLPLPPATSDPQAQLPMMLGITHLLFDPQSPGNLPLSRNLSMLGSAMETIELQSAGVLLRIKDVQPEPSPTE
jgi:hypothetical protein